jgi:hypothetical protein
VNTCFTASGSETNTQVPSCGSRMVNMSPYRAWHSSSVRSGSFHQRQVVRGSDQSGPGGSSGRVAVGTLALSAVATPMLGLCLPTYRKGLQAKERRRDELRGER